MRYFIGIDGGGSKTRVTCFDADGKAVGEALVGSTYYRQDGVEAVIDTLKAGLACAPPDLREACACFGMPGYGENILQDEKAARQIARALLPLPVCFENDVAAGWAGALALGSGVNIVAGTGSMAYGRDPGGKAARCGGWSEFFSDEGSGYWLGKKSLELFSKQCDGRAEKGTLYEIMRRHFALQDDFELIGIVEEEYVHSREKTASLQRVLHEAAMSGDAAAKALYSQAAKELALIVCGIASQLDFAGSSFSVSYTGGLFNLTELILQPMKMEIQKRFNAELSPPLLPPCEGAALFAAQAFAPQELERFKTNLLRSHDSARA